MRPSVIAMTIDCIQTPAWHIKTGDTLILDCGYGPQSDDRECRVLEAIHSDGLFGDPGIFFRVRDGRDEFYTHDFGHDENVSRVVRR